MPPSNQQQQELAKIRFFAAEGNAAAQREMGRRCSDGLEMLQDETEAAKWFRKAAKQGDAESEYQLGRRYADGIGVPQNDELAKKWLHRAAVQGHSQAASLLGVRYQAIRIWFIFLFAVLGGVLGFYLLGGVVGGLIFGIACCLLFQIFLK